MFFHHGTKNGICFLVWFRPIFFPIFLVFSRSHTVPLQFTLFPSSSLLLPLSWIKLFIAAWKLEKKIIFLRNSANFPSFDDCQTWGLAWHTDSWKSMHQHIMTNNSSNTNKHLMWCSMRNSRLTRFSRVNLLWTQTRRIFTTYLGILFQKYRS